MKTVSALIVVLIVLIVGGYFLFSQYRCMILTICFVDSEFQVNGVEYKVNQSKVDDFVNNNKKSKTVSEIWLWQKYEGPYKFDQRKYKNKKSKLKLEYKSDGKVMSTVSENDNSETKLQDIGLLGSQEGNVNVFTLYLTPEYANNINEKQLNQEFGEALYWAITGDGPQSLYSEGLIIRK